AGGVFEDEVVDDRALELARVIGHVERDAQMGAHRTRILEVAGAAAASPHRGAGPARVIEPHRDADDAMAGRGQKRSRGRAVDSAREGDHDGIGLPLHPWQIAQGRARVKPGPSMMGACCSHSTAPASTRTASVSEPSATRPCTLRARYPATGWRLPSCTGARTGRTHGRAWSASWARRPIGSHPPAPTWAAAAGAWCRGPPPPSPAPPSNARASARS